MEVGKHQCNAANFNQSKAQLQLELSLAQFSPSLFSKNVVFYTFLDFLELKNKPYVTRN